MSNLTKAINLQLNPVLKRDLKSMLRSMRLFIVLMIYTIVLAVVSIGVLNIDFGGMTFEPEQANLLYYVIGVFQIGLVMVIVPAFAGSAISAEREKQTLDLLLVTKMSPFSIIIGKFFSSLAIAIMLIFSSLPVYGLLMYYGNLSMGKLLVTVLYTIFTAALSGAISIACSSFIKKTSLAIVVSNVMNILITIGHLVLLVFLTYILLSNDIKFPPFIAKLFFAMNPGIGFFSLLDSQMGYGEASDFLYMFANSIVGRNNIGDMQVTGNVVTSFFVNLPIHVYSILLGIIAIVILLLVSSKRLEKRRIK